MVLLAATVAALVWANSPWYGSYEALWSLTIRLSFGTSRWTPSLRFLINDGLMTVFFLLAGLEIRRELHHGALSSLRVATVPIAAALGGMLVPALIFLAVAGAEFRRGWAIPTATDIAFAIGALTLLAQRVPPSMRVILLTLAVIDDVGAILITTLFYSSAIGAHGLWIAAAGVGGILALRRFEVRSAVMYVLSALVTWAGLRKGGVNPTMAGAILGLLAPLQAPLSRALQTPVETLERVLHPWVAYGIMPLFALANAGVVLDQAELGQHGVGLLIVAIVLALVLGKPLGIVFFTWLASRSGLGALPDGLGGRGVLLVGCLGGIGFTMALFLATLAFDDPGTLAAAKAAILFASAIAGLGGWVLGRVLFPKRNEPRNRTHEGAM